MRRFFTILLGALAMIAVALLSAFLTMRLAIHGREVEVPNVAGLTVAEANDTASKLGLHMNLENHFYSTATPAGRILSQFPAAGTKVRREWVMRVTESIGPQRVSVPNVVGETEREASVTIRRLALDLGTVAYIPAPGSPGVVLAQTPTPAAEGVDGPRISLLVSEPLPVVRTRQAAAEDGADAAAAQGAADASAPATDTANKGNDSAVADGGPTLIGTPLAATAVQPEAYVMPNVLGLPLTVATARLAAMGLHVTSVETAFGGFKSVAPIASPSAPGSAPPGVIRPIAPPAAVTLPNTVVSQSPGIGRRVTKTDTIHLVVTH
jgi:beta-lactam-binding protein with PASTA domain